ncbi:DUF5693 family protein [Colibacter massiliensis]|uniref:DUF5693 family protein n=1 Tax=Colibacter massiliensis TaxID=1852379 RepID=UPI003F9105F0
MVKCKRKKSMVIMGIIVFIGLICAFALCAARWQVERNSMTVEQAMDYDAVISVAQNDGYSPEEAMEMAKNAGITSFAIYDTTLNKLSQRGDISLITPLMAQIYYPQLAAAVGTAYDYYLIGKPRDEKDLYFDEVKEDLGLRLGMSNVAEIWNDTYRILGIRGVMPDLGDVNLGILSADANRIADSGFRVILRPTNYADPDKVHIDAFFRRAEKIRNVSGIIFVGKEVLGYSADDGQRDNLLAYTGMLMKEKKVPFYMIEAANQLQYDRQDGMYELADIIGYDTARVYAMSKDELDKVTEEEGAMRFYISDLERNCRVNLYPIYKKPLHGLNRTERTFKYIRDASAKLEERGYAFGKASIMPVYYPSRSLAAIVAAAALCGMLFTLNLILPLRDKINYIFTFIAVVVGSAGYVKIASPLFLQVVAVGIAVCAPVAAILILLDYFRAKEIREVQSYGKVIRDGILTLTLAVCIAMIGGFFIAALLGDIRFFMEFEFYRGVKLTFVLPLVLTAVAYIRRFPLLGEPVQSAESFVDFIRKFLQLPMHMGSFLIVAVLGLAAFIFVGRSGHTAGVPVPGAEVAMRRFLENIMYARPREKEFLVGHPAFFLMVAAVYRRWPQVLHFFLVIASVIGLGSMVETFAHIRTPFLMSFIRGINGWLTGLVVGILLIAVLAFFRYLTLWLGKQVAHDD